MGSKGSVFLIGIPWFRILNQDLRFCILYQDPLVLHSVSGSQGSAFCIKISWFCNKDQDLKVLHSLSDSVGSAFWIRIRGSSFCFRISRFYIHNQDLEFLHSVSGSGGSVFWIRIIWFSHKICFIPDFLNGEEESIKKFSFQRYLNMIINKVQIKNLTYFIYLWFYEILVNNIFICINKNCPLIKFICMNVLLNVI